MKINAIKFVDYGPEQKIINDYVYDDKCDYTDTEEDSRIIRIYYCREMFMLN